MSQSVADPNVLTMILRGSLLMRLCSYAEQQRAYAQMARSGAPTPSPTSTAAATPTLAPSGTATSTTVPTSTGHVDAGPGTHRHICADQHANFNAHDYSAAGNIDADTNHRPASSTNYAGAWPIWPRRIFHARRGLADVVTAATSL